MIDYQVDKIAQSMWFPTYYSENKNDYVSVNGVHYRCEKFKCDKDCQKHNPKYWSNNKITDLSTERNIDICCYGDSFTFGPMLSEKQVWPNLLAENLKIKTFNFGVPGGGIDACYLNFKKSLEDFHIKKAIFLLPDFQRKLLRFNIGSNYFRFPIVARIDWNYPDPIAKSLNINESLMNVKINSIKKQIINVFKMNNYNRKIIKQILKLSKSRNIKVFFSSWSEDTYKILKEIGSVNLLPIFDLNWFPERVPDNMHPTYKHYSKWVELIKNIV